MTLSYTKDPFGRVTLTAPSGGTSYQWYKSGDGLSWFTMPVAKYSGSSITDNRPGWDWGSLETTQGDYGIFNGIQAVFGYPIPAPLFHVTGDVYYRCVVDGVEHLSLPVDQRPNRQEAFNSIVDKFLGQLINDPTAGSEYNTAAEMIATLAGMYSLASGTERRSAILTIAKRHLAVFPVLRPFVSTQYIYLQSDSRHGYSLWFAWKAFHADDPEFGADLLDALDLYTRLLYTQISFDFEIPHTESGDLPTSTLAGTYLTFSSDQQDYYLWFRVGASGSDPHVTGRVGIRVDLPANYGFGPQVLNATLAAVAAACPELEQFNEIFVTRSRLVPKGNATQGTIPRAARQVTPEYIQETYPIRVLARTFVPNIWSTSYAGASNWTTPCLLHLALVATTPELSMWHGNQGVLDLVREAMDGLDDAGMIAADGSMPYQSLEEATWGEVTYGGFTYSQIRIIADLLSWRPASMALAENWFKNIHYPLSEPAFYYDGDIAVTMYAEIQVVTVAQRMMAYYHAEGSLPQEFVDALYSAAFDADGYFFEEGDDSGACTAVGYKPEGWAASTNLSSINLGGENLWWFYAVPHMLADATLPLTEWAWELVPMDLSASDRTPTSFTLHFSSVYNASSYRIYRNGSRWPDGGTQFTATAIPVTGVESGDSWSVAAVVNGVEGSTGASLTVLLGVGTFDCVGVGPVLPVNAPVTALSVSQQGTFAPLAVQPAVTARAAGLSGVSVGVFPPKAAVVPVSVATHPLTGVRQGVFGAVAVSPPAAVTSSTLLGGQLGSFTVAAVTLRPSVAPVARDCFFSTPAVSIKPLVAAPGVQGEQRGSFGAVVTVLGVSVSATVTVVGNSCGSLTVVPVAAPLHNTAPAKLAGIANSIRAPDGHPLDLRHIDGTPYNFRRVA